MTEYTKDLDIVTNTIIKQLKKEGITKYSRRPKKLNGYVVSYRLNRPADEFNAEKAGLHLVQGILKKAKDDGFNKYAELSVEEVPIELHSEFKNFDKARVQVTFYALPTSAYETEEKNESSIKVVE